MSQAACMVPLIKGAWIDSPRHRPRKVLTPFSCLNRTSLLLNTYSSPLLATATLLATTFLRPSRSPSSSLCGFRAPPSLRRARPPLRARLPLLSGSKTRRRPSFPPASQTRCRAPSPAAGRRASGASQRVFLRPRCRGGGRRPATVRIRASKNSTVIFFATSNERRPLSPNIWARENNPFRPSVCGIRWSSSLTTSPTMHSCKGAPFLGGPRWAGGGPKKSLRKGEHFLYAYPVAR